MWLIKSNDQSIQINITPGQFHDYYKPIEATRKHIAEATNISAEEKAGIVTTGYGHMGDGDIHINIAIPGYDNPSLLERINASVWPFIMDWTK